MPSPSYKTYVDDRAHMKAYEAYQKRYASRIRESDKTLIEMIRREAGDGRATLLDIGCSTGNLLLHLKHALPRLELVGGDLVGEIIRGCRKNPDLAGIRFEVMDMFRLPRKPLYDIVVCNASLMFFTPPEFEKALRSIAGALKPGGRLAAFDYFHPFEQELAVVEVSKAHPKGLKLFMRSYRVVEAALKKAGLRSPAFAPFYVPIDLPTPASPADITTRTVKTDGGARLSFRGSLFQPWCHLLAKKA